MAYEEKGLSELEDKIRKLDYLVKVNAFLIYRKGGALSNNRNRSSIQITGVEGEYRTKSIIPY